MINTTALDGHVCDMIFTTDDDNSTQTIAAFYYEVRPQLEESLQTLQDSHIEWKIHSCLEVKMKKGK